MMYQDRFSIGREELVGGFLQDIGKGFKKVTGAAASAVEFPFKKLEQALPKDLKPFARILGAPMAISTAPVKFTGNLAIGKVSNPAKSLTTFIKEGVGDLKGAGSATMRNPVLRKMALGIAATVVLPAVGPAGFAAAVAIDQALQASMKDPKTGPAVQAALGGIKASANLGDKQALEVVARLNAAKKRVPYYPSGGASGASPFANVLATAAKIRAASMAAGKASVPMVHTKAPPKVTFQRGLTRLTSPVNLRAATKSLPKLVVAPSPAGKLAGMSTKQLQALMTSGTVPPSLKVQIKQALERAISRKMAHVKFERASGTHKGFLVDQHGNVRKRRKFRAAKGGQPGWLAQDGVVSHGTFEAA